MKQNSVERIIDRQKILAAIVAVEGARPAVGRYINGSCNYSSQAGKEMYPEFLKFLYYVLNDVSKGNSYGT